MNINKHIEKELLFKSNIKDITSISLDCDYKVSGNEVVGNFLISGEYKTHEISLNRESFNFKIPFKENVDNDIDMSTVKVDISNFIYDYKKDELIVNIDYEISGERKDVLIFDDEESLDEFLNKREVEVVDTRLDEIKENIDKDLKVETKQNIEEKVEIIKTSIEEKKDEVIEVLDKSDRKEEIEKIIVSETDEREKNDRDKVSSDEIINNVNMIDDKFVTYKIYKIKENETLESIVIKNKTTIDELKEYNDLNNLNINDKIIIPIYE